ncbi:MAG: hypothetical protein K5643_03300 [Saccharofermentans sp.]|nr:hypothetical protein [Saccharofermentans sp.]
MQLLGLDIGTSSICGILCDPESGKVLKSITRPNDSAFPVAKPWERKQDPRRILAIVQETADALLDGASVAAIGVSGQMHGILYLDKEGEPVSELITWQDQRGELPFDGSTYTNALCRRGGMKAASGYGSVTHFYNTVNQQIPVGAVTFCTVADWIVMRLTGRKMPLLHASNAASLGLYDLISGTFSAEAVQRAGMDPDYYPAQTVKTVLAGETEAHIPVAVALGDNQASVLGAVCDLTDSLLVNVGTGSQISGIVSAPVQQEDLECRPLTEERYLLVGASLCGGRAYALLERLFRTVASDVTGQNLESAYPAMAEWLEKAEDITDHLNVNTLFNGTRSQPDLRGSISNIGLDNFTPAHLCDGVLNGMVRELYDMYTQMRPCLTNTPRRLIGAGNGLRLNPALARRMETAFGLPLSIPGHREEAAFGAALFAGTAAGLYPAIEQALTRIQYERRSV